MEEIKNCVLSICVTSVCGFILKLMLPKDDYGKILKIVISVFILCSMLSPILSMKENIAFSDFYFERNADENDLSKELILNTEKGMENELKMKCEELLKNSNIDFGNVVIETEINENSDIEITEFSIEADKSDETAIKNIMKDNFGFEPEIIFSEG